MVSLEKLVLIKHKGIGIAQERWHSVFFSLVFGGGGGRGKSYSSPFVVKLAIVTPSTVILNK